VETVVAAAVAAAVATKAAAAAVEAVVAAAAVAVVAIAAAGNQAVPEYFPNTLPRPVPVSGTGRFLSELLLLAPVFISCVRELFHQNFFGNAMGFHQILQ